MKRIRITPAARISLGLAMLTLTLLIGAEMLGVIPEPGKAVLDMRKKVCESLAVYASLAVGNGDIRAIETTMQSLKDRNEDVMSLALRSAEGSILAKAGDHQLYWRQGPGGASTATNVQVPVFKGNGRWGTFEVSFKDTQADAWMGLGQRPIIKLIAIVIPFAFVGYLMMMKKTLRYLDPSAVVPARVKSALDSLVEGVVLLDDRERIVLANSAFIKNFGDSGQTLVGRKASELNWKHARSQQQVVDFPWRQAMREGHSQTAVPLTLAGAEGGGRIYMVNGAPILDGAGKMRGALATFDDVSIIEQKNSELQNMVEALKQSEDAIRRKNQELEVLATQDPLTHCLNRRAFFEKFEVEFSRAQRYGNNFSCIMVDIDHFKSINDNHGHPVGDKVLQKVGSILKNCVRDSDFVCRYGGEEFCIILPETNAQGGLNTAERIRRTIGSTNMSGLQVTVSLGVSSLESAPANPSELLSQADKSLYAAKTGGRNRVVCFSEQVASLPAKDAAKAPSREPDKKGAEVHIPHHIVNALMLALEHRDMATAEHSRQVADLCVATAQGLMSINECYVLEVAALLHDIGKLGVPDSILLKPGPLTDEEWTVMRDHERRSVDVIASTFLCPELVDIVKNHSQRFDGGSSHEPARLAGKKIPLGARILNIADTFSAIISDRPYRRGRSYDVGFKELRRCAGGQFDPDLVTHFIEVVKARDESRRRGRLAASSSVQLEIGREVEKIFAAVNNASLGTLSVSAEQLATRATKYGLNQIADTAMQIEKAAVEKHDQIQIVELTSKLAELCDNREQRRIKVSDDGKEVVAA